MGFMLSMMVSPVIRRPSLESTAAMAQPDGNPDLPLDFASYCTNLLN